MIKAEPSTYSLNCTFIIIEMADGGTDIILKNVKFWIADLLKLFQEQTQPVDDTENSSRVKTKTDIISRIKPLCVVGVVVDIRNEKKECLTNSSSSDANESNRPIVYGKLIVFITTNYTIYSCSGCTNPDFTNIFCF